MIWSVLLACQEVPVEPVSYTELPAVLPALELGDTWEPVDAEVEPVCERVARAMLREPVVWSGDVGTCDAGVLPAALAERGLPLLDLARELAGLPALPVQVDADAQRCALAMHATATLSHQPEGVCVDQEVQDTAATSLLANVPLDQAVPAFLVDPDNDGHLAHRRWLLSGQLDGLRLGSTDQYTCLGMDAVAGPSTGPDVVAWPPPGRVPRELLSTRGFDVSEVGWSLQSDVVDLSGAVVTVRVAGAPYAAEVWELEPGAGSLSAVAFRVPDLPDVPEYVVEVTQVPAPFVYTVSIADCPGAGEPW